MGTEAGASWARLSIEERASLRDFLVSSEPEEARMPKYTLWFGLLILLLCLVLGTSRSFTGSKIPANTPVRLTRLTLKRSASEPRPRLANASLGSSANGEQLRDDFGWAL